MEPLDRTHYRLLMAVHRHGTISKAAAALHMTQSAASQRLLQAERRLGVVLTTKNGRTVSLTSAALHLVQAGRQSERLLEAAEAEALWLDHSSAPTLMLAVGVHDALWWLPPILTDLDSTPDCATLEVIRCADDEGPRFVADGHADIHLTPYATSGSTSRTLFADRLVGVVGTTNPLAAKQSLTSADFHGCDYATYSKAPREGFEHETFLAPHDAVPATITRFESVTTIIAVVGAGPRITILPAWAVPDSSTVVVRPLDPEPPAITWSLLSRDINLPSPLDHARERLILQLPGARPPRPA
jgi:LysR family transcriptional regulator, regulator for metE and metH